MSRGRKKIASGGENISVDLNEVIEAEINPEEVEGEEEDKKPDNIVQFRAPYTKLIQYELEKTNANMDDIGRIIFVSKALDYDIFGIGYKGQIHVEKDEKNEAGSIIVGTDGIRLHYAQIDTKIIPGDYKLSINKKCISLSGQENTGSETKYPDWRKIILSNPKEYTTIDFNGTSISNNISSTAIMSRRFYSLIKSIKKIINLKYLDDLTKEEWIVYLDEKKALNTPVMFKRACQKELVALIMPIEPEDD
jgi:hypothetical protein